MANGDDFDPDYDEGVEFDVPEQQQFLYDLLGFVGETQDQYAHDMFWSFSYDDTLSYGERLDIYEQFADYMWEEYGVDFEVVWDWDDFREWYGAQ